MYKDNMNRIGRIIQRISGKRLLLAIILALFLGFVFMRIDGASRAGAMFAFFTAVGFAAFAIMLHLIDRVAFWFCIAMAVVWALLPVGAAIAAERFSGSGFPGIGGAIGQGLILAITIPIGIIGCIIFLAIAFRKYAGQVTARANSSDIPTQIRELDKLRDDGILSQEEFEAKKADLLSRM